MDYYADAEGGAYLPDPTHADLAGLITDLNTSDNTFFVVYPEDDDLEWFVSVSKNVGAFGGYEVRRYDPSTRQDATSTAADPTGIATDLLTWVTNR